tara:strand:- start:532 stop:2727 length:2196 start_codon:yes stop_codon:yes gene_type:complete
LDKKITTKIEARKIKVRQYASKKIVVVGNPNSGKSTLFNRLTGLRQKTGNYPGVTVEKHTGTAEIGSIFFEFTDLPGIYSLFPDSTDERIAVDVILGRLKNNDHPDGIVAVLDSTHLYQGLYLIRQLIDLDLPMIIALTMTDISNSDGLGIDTSLFEKHLGGVKIIPVVATTGKGINHLRKLLVDIDSFHTKKLPHYWPELSETAKQLQNQLPEKMSLFEVERALIEDSNIFTNTESFKLINKPSQNIKEIRKKLFSNQSPIAQEARKIYCWIRTVLNDIQKSIPIIPVRFSQLIRWLNKPIPGTISLFLVMAIVFQAVFAWATPMMNVIDDATSNLGLFVVKNMPEGAFTSLIADGIIAGVGSVIIFIPQIAILFLFIILLEDSGYLARAAYLLDRVMRSVGLSGQSIIPMISSFACAVPGIMATRVIPNRRDRLATIFASPFMTCSARLPIYALLIAAFIPSRQLGFINLQGLVLFGLYMLGICMGLMTALLLRKTALQGSKTSFVIMLPEFRRPNLNSVLIQLLTRIRVFLERAGTVIFSVAVIIWALAYYPQSDVIASRLAEQKASISTGLSIEEYEVISRQLDNQAAADQLSQSWLGRTGKFIAPVFQPLGWDWKISSAVIAGFPAREVVIPVLATVYAVGNTDDGVNLSDRLKSAKFPDGSLIFTLPMVLGLLIFYAFCLQCVATLAVIRRETNSVALPLLAWIYMTSLGYLGAFIVYQIGINYV